MIGEPRVVGQAYEDMLHEEMEAAAAAAPSTPSAQALSATLEEGGFVVEATEFTDQAGRPVRALNSGEAYHITARGRATASPS